MKQEIRGQIIFLLGMLCSGMGVMLMYEPVRLLRWLFVHKKPFVWLEDILFWTLASVPVFIVNLQLNNGYIRWYGIATFMIGAYIYVRGISMPVRSLLLSLHSKLTRMIEKIGFFHKKNRKIIEK